MHALALSHCAFKDTDCMGYSAGCRFAVERVHVELRGQDTTGIGGSSTYCGWVKWCSHTDMPSVSVSILHSTYLARFQIYHIVRNYCDFKMLSLIGDVFGFEHIPK